MNKKKVYRVAKKHDISIEDAKAFIQARADHRFEHQENLPFHKWEKMNSFDDTDEVSEDEEYDNLFGFGRKRRKKSRKFFKRLGGLVKRRKKFHRKVLRTIINPVAMASPKGRRKVRAMVKKMARKVDNCSCGTTRREAGVRSHTPNRPTTMYSRPRTMQNFDGAKAKNWIKDNKMIVAGGLVAVLFFTPFGKKLMGKL